MLSEVFFSLLLTSIIGLILALARMCYKSKCSVIRCCGLEIDRNVETEEKIDEIEMNRNSDKNLNNI